MLAYHNDPGFKQRVMAAAIDQNQGKTQSISCEALSITGDIDDPSPHHTTAEYLGFPEWLEQLRDFICFDDVCREWHIGIKMSIPVGLNHRQFEAVGLQFEAFILDGIRTYLAGIKSPRTIRVRDQLDKYSGMPLEDKSFLFQRIQFLSEIQMVQVKSNDGGRGGYSPAQRQADKFTLAQFYMWKLIGLLKGAHYSGKAA